MSTIRFGLYAAAFILAVTTVIAVTLPDFVTPALLGLFGAAK